MIAYSRMSEIPFKKESLLYRLLVSPSYRVVRHALMILAIAAVGLSQTAHSLQANSDAIGNRIYVLSVFMFIAFMAVGYLHIYLLVPRLLLRKRYLAYLSVSVLSVWLLAMMKPFQEYLVNEYLGLPHIRSSYINVVSFLDTLSDFMLIFLCITGASMTVLLKNWLMESRRVNELEKRRLQSEVDAMKEQVNPDLLFHTLNRTGNLALAEPDKAADMVLQLSQLLRYELYEGSREKVLLRSEIDFLKHYLTLEQFYYDFFDFDITVKGDTARIFVAPLLFIPFVQAVVKKVRHTTDRTAVEVSFEGHPDRLDFTVRYTGTPLPASDPELSSVLSRLGHLYPAGFSFAAGDDPATQQVFIRLQLKTR